MREVERDGDARDAVGREPLIRQPIVGEREPPYLQLRIHRRGEPRGQLDAFALDRAKAGHGKRDGVEARLHLGKQERPRSGGTGRLRLTGELAGQRDRHTWKHGTGVVEHGTCKPAK